MHAPSSAATARMDTRVAGSSQNSIFLRHTLARDTAARRAISSGSIGVLWFLLSPSIDSASISSRARARSASGEWAGARSMRPGVLPTIAHIIPISVSGTYRGFNEHIDADTFAPGEVVGLPDVRARIGGRFRDLRLAQNLTQEAVAERAGVSYKFLGEVERGSANPSLLTIDRICQALGVEIDDLWGEGGSARARREHGDAVFVLRETLGAMQKVLDRAKAGSRRRASRKRRS